VRAVARGSFDRQPDGKTHVVRVDLQPRDGGRWVAAPLTGQGSHHTAAMARATGLAIVPDGHGILAADDIEVIPLIPGG